MALMTGARKSGKTFENMSLVQYVPCLSMYNELPNWYVKKGILHTRTQNVFC